MSLVYDATGSGPPLVLLHASVVDSRIWTPLVPALAERSRVVTYDQRGYGRSPGWDGPYSLVDDLLGVLDELGIERAALVGLSRGGGIALSAALEAPARVAALVLVASALPGHRVTIDSTPEQDARWEAAEARADFAEMAELDLELWAPLGADEELRAMFHENSAASNGADPAVDLPDVKSRLGEIGVPALVVTPLRDVRATGEIGEILAAGIPGAQHAAITEADHMVPWRAAEELAQLVIAFLSS